MALTKSTVQTRHYTIFARAVELYTPLPPFLLGSLKDGMGASPPNKPVCLAAGKECTYMLWSMRSYQQPSVVFS